MCFDGDLYFLKDPFKVFDEQPDIDICYTTRHYDFIFPVNSGVWGYRYNSNVDKFRNWWITEVNTPSWEPYVYLRKNHPYTNDYNIKDWWIDQDFLNVVHARKEWVNHELNINLNIKDIGFKYNMICSPDDKESIIAEHDPSVLHYKNSHGKQRWEQEI